MWSNVKNETDATGWQHIYPQMSIKFMRIKGQSNQKAVSREKSFTTATLSVFGPH